MFNKKKLFIAISPNAADYTLNYIVFMYFFVIELVVDQELVWLAT